MAADENSALSIDRVRRLRELNDRNLENWNRVFCEDPAKHVENRLFAMELHGLICQILSETERIT